MDIIRYLRKNGPMLSSSIKKKLLELGFSETAARQRISRLGKDALFPVLKLPANLFPKRSSFLYLQEHESTAKFFLNLVSALKATNSVHYA